MEILRSFSYLFLFSFLETSLMHKEIFDLTWSKNFQPTFIKIIESPGSFYRVGCENIVTGGFLLYIHRMKRDTSDCCIIPFKMGTCSTKINTASLGTGKIVVQNNKIAIIVDPGTCNNVTIEENDTVHGIIPFRDNFQMITENKNGQLLILRFNEKGKLLDYIYNPAVEDWAYTPIALFFTFKDESDKFIFYYRKNNNITDSITANSSIINVRSAKDWSFMHYYQTYHKLDSFSLANGAFGLCYERLNYLGLRCHILDLTLRPKISGVDISYPPSNRTWGFTSLAVHNLKDGGAIVAYSLDGSVYYNRINPDGSIHDDQIRVMGGGIGIKVYIQEMNDGEYCMYLLSKHTVKAYCFPLKS